MKRQELIIIGGVALVAAIVSLVVSGIIFGSPKKNPIHVPVVNKITSTFPEPKNDSNYTTFFNDKANNPTELIQIGNSTNSIPFQGQANN